MKIAVIGGGSTYTPELMEGLIEAKTDQSLPVREITLMDIDADRLATVGGFCDRMIRHRKAEIKLQLSTDLKESVNGADYVLTQVRVGQMQARHDDILLGQKHDMIGQETVGIGGFAKALRTAPVIEKIVREIRANDNRAWLINFTNPVAIISQVFIDYYSDIKWIGLCNYPWSAKVEFLKILNESSVNDIHLDYVGFNHFSWIKKVWFRDQDVTREILDNFMHISKHANLPKKHFNPLLIKSLGMIPNPYLLHFYNQRDVLKGKKEAVKTRAEEVMEVERELLTMYQDKKLVTKPEILSKRGGAHYSSVAVALLRSIHNNGNDVHIVNTRNNGAIKGVPDNASIETSCVVNSSGVYPLADEATPVSILGLLNHVKAYEMLAAKAAVEGDIKAAYLSLVNNPLVPDANVAADALKELFELNQRYLPQFDQAEIAEFFNP